MIERVAGWHFGLRLGLAICFGVVTALGFEPFAWWPLLVPGIAGFSLLALGAGRLPRALALGLAYGLGYMGVGLNWMRAIFVEAMLGIVLVTALVYVLLAALVFAVRRLAVWPLAAAAAWVAVEAMISRWPFDGFGWMRIGYALTDAPLAGLYPLVGVPGMTFAVALLAQGLLWLLDRASWRRSGALAAALGVVAATAWAGAAVPPGAAGETVAVGWVQGGAPGGGVYGIGEPRTMPRNHLAETEALFAEVAAGRQPAPDFVVWPENGTDLDPYHDQETAGLLRQALEIAGVPIFVGTILDGPGEDERQTASLWLDPQDGETARYVKRGIVPFGEFVPYRDLLLPLFPILRYVGAQSIAGTEPGVIPARTAAGEFPLGVMICYDVSFDRYAHDTVLAGGEVLVVQSSNAMYQGTGQIDQQFAITRARAAELRREILVVTTSGVSGLIRPDGSVDFSVSDPGAASGVVELPRRTGLTPAVTVAPVLEGGLAAATLVLVAVGLLPASLRFLAAWRRLAE
ncbi:MAG: apolipoprotein N-acyltransferase [Propionicimonas sp.]|nr:apolipoprotein N-acyltransferase [Propionicimonas sp.]